MLTVGQFFSRHSLSFLFSTITLSTTAIITNPGIFLGGALFLGTYSASHFVMKYRQKNQVMKIAGISRDEYKHIDSQLANASKHIQTLNQNYIRVRSISAFKQLLEINRYAKNIIKIVKANPQKFYNVEQFFYAHLESAVQLTEKYTLLSKQPVKDKELQLTLAKTRETLTELNETIQSDLRDVLSNDIDHLQMEIEFANRSNDRKREQLEWRGED